MRAVAIEAEKFSAGRVRYRISTLAVGMVLLGTHALAERHGVASQASPSTTTAGAEQTNSPTIPAERMASLEAELERELAAGNEEAAAEILRTMIEGGDDRSERRNQLESLDVAIAQRRAESLIEEGDASSAISLLRLVQNSYPSNTSLNGMLLKTIAESQGIVPILQSWPRIGFEYPQFALGMYRLQSAGIPTRATIEYEYIPSLANSATELEFEMAVDYLCEGRWSQAAIKMQRAQKLGFDARRSMLSELMFMVMDLQQGRTGNAVSRGQQLVEQETDLPEVYHQLGLAYLYTERLDDAIAQLEEALRLEPYFVDAHFDLGVALRRAGREAEAQEHFATAQSLAVETEARLAASAAAPSPDSDGSTADSP